jgi:hypothetical protein
VITTILKRSKALSVCWLLALVVPAAASDGSAPATASRPDQQRRHSLRALEQIAAPVACIPTRCSRSPDGVDVPARDRASRAVRQGSSGLKGDQLNDETQGSELGRQREIPRSFPQVLSLMDGKLD